MHVQNIAGLEYPLLRRFEVREQSQIIVWEKLDRIVARRADLPPSPAKALDQEHVVLIEVRAHTTLVHGVASSIRQLGMKRKESSNALTSGT